MSQSCRHRSCKRLGESHYAAPTIWSLIVSIGSGLQDLSKCKVQLPVVNFGPLEARADALEEKLRFGTDKLKMQVVTLATGISTRVGKLEKAVKRLHVKEPSVDKDLEEALMNSGGVKREAGGKLNQAFQDQVQSLQVTVQELDLRLQQVRQITRQTA